MEKELFDVFNGEIIFDHSTSNPSSEGQPLWINHCRGSELREISKEKQSKFRQKIASETEETNPYSLQS